MGLMQGIVTTKKAADICAEALKQGLILITAGTNVIRLLPPLVITESDVDEMIQKLAGVLEHI